MTPFADSLHAVTFVPSLRAGGGADLELRDVIDCLSESVTAYDRQARFVFLNASAARLFGLPAEALHGKRPWELVPEGPRTPFREALEAVLAGAPKTHVVTYVASFDRWYEVDIYPHPEGALAVARDITEPRRAHDALRESEERFRAIVEHAPEAIIIFSVDTGKFVGVNEATEKLFGRTRAALLELGPVDVSPERQPDGTPSALAAQKYIEQLLDQGSADIEWALIGAGGRPLLAHLRARVLPSKKPILLMGSIFDVTASRKEEERRSEAQRLETVGRLASGVAHDFNNMLSVILGYTEILLLDAAPDDRRRAELEEVQIAGQRAASVARQLLALSRRQVPEPKVIEVADLVGAMMKMLKMAVGEGIAVIMPGLGPGSRVCADPGQLEQVLLNLAVNARDAMPSGGTLTIEVDDIELRADEVAGASPGAYVMLTIADTGVGMDSAVMARIFEPFFTTKTTGRETGLGLATVFAIVAQSGGQIAVESEIGGGTAFRIYLPRTGAPATQPTRPTLSPAELRGTETILLVEDEEQVRTVVQTILVKNGYHVLDAQNGGEAMLISERQETKIDLLLTDMAMPRMTGRQLVARLSAARPEMKVLYLSGYADSTAFEPGVACLQKPITPNLLLQRVREVLDQ